MKRLLAALVVAVAIWAWHMDVHAGGGGAAGAAGILGGLGDALNKAVEDEQKAEVLAEQKRQFDMMMRSGAACTTQTTFTSDGRMIMCRTCCTGTHCMTSCF